MHLKGRKKEQEADSFVFGLICAGFLSKFLLDFEDGDDMFL
jgi:hypothetical protein